ncbi:MAG: PEGA domain-containing protein, partial [Holophagales bacterium]|nr:PEGA domain-containing protein [Holophagales bacterium]
YSKSWRFYRPYTGFYASFWTPYWSWYAWPRYHGVYAYPATVRVGSGYGDGPPGALDLDVSPEEAQIFIDGEFVGQADDYDGFPTYLHLEPGTYEVAIYHEGYETIFRQYSIYSGVVIDVEDRMRPGEAVHPDDRGPKSTKNRDERIRRNREREAEAKRVEEEMAAIEAEASTGAPPRRPGDDGSLSGDVGRLHLEIWPADAAVYLDGHFLGTGEEVGGMSAGLVVTPGRHQLQIIRPDHLPRDLDLDIDRGERLDLVIELEPADGP